MKLAGVLLVALVACSPSSPPAFEGLQPSIEVVSSVDYANNAYLFVDASFSTGSLESGYVVTASYEGTDFDVPLVSSTDPDAPSSQFTGRISLVDDPSGKEITVTFTRGIAVATSTVTMPDGFAITSVMGSLYGPPITATWSPTRADAIAWIADGANEHGFQCATGGGSVAPDTGTVIIPSGAIQIQQTASPCNGMVYLDRSRPGELDAQFASGSIIASQTRTVILL